MVADTEAGRHDRPAPEPDTVAAGTATAGTVAADTAVLEEIQQRVLWLATRIIDAANHDRHIGDGVKVGGHQASG
jgi:pyruvate dehydrogenase E1 component